MKTIKDLQQMIKEPASKEWFAKHGSPKHKALAKVARPKDWRDSLPGYRNAKTMRETSHDRSVDENPREHYNK